MQLANKRLLVTGAAGGIGAALCKKLTELNVELVLTCFNPDALSDLAQELGSSHHYIAADVASTQGRQDILQCCQQAGGVDGVINIAGILDFNLFADQSVAVIEKTLQVNTLAPMFLCHLLLPMLKDKKAGVILNVGSVFGSIGHPGFAVYCASKAAIKTFTEALDRELADTAIKVAYIAPRATSTRLNSEKVVAMNAALGNKSDSPEVVAEAIIRQIQGGPLVQYLGWPEKLFVRINALFPGIVRNALVKNLNVIKIHANS